MAESIRIEFNVPMKMRDGISLRADIYRSETDSKVPGILVRLPYGKDAMFNAKGSGYMSFQKVARAGYAVAIQDCRGTSMSDGDNFYPLLYEVEDGYDSVEWMASQPWCTGNIGMYGFSYLGFTQWAAAVSQPPHLKAICPGQHGVVDLGVPPVKNGIFNIFANEFWTLGFIQNKLMRSKLPPEKIKEIREKLGYIIDHIDELNRFLPLKDAPIVKIAQELGMPPFFTDWLDHIVDTEYWAKFCNPAPLEKINIPCFHNTGWYDIMTSQVLKNYMEMKKQAGSELTRKNQKLLIGPWVHGCDIPNNSEGPKFGPQSTWMAIDFTGMHIKWFDRWLKGIDNGIDNDPPIRIFVMGDNIWRNENEWPLARTNFTKYYLHSKGHANSLKGNGTLSTAIPNAEEPDVFLYDPRNPVPSMPEFSALCDQSDLEKRDDILVYTTEPLKQDTEITGPIDLVFWASSSAVDTDFTGKLVDIWPDGKAYNLIQSILRTRYRDSVTKPELMKPNHIYEFHLELGATSNVFKAGHRIRVEISSSDFPKCERNLNTGHAIGQDDEWTIALNTIHHSKDFPSHLVLPIIPR
jgi:uncharacterized protein